MHLTPDTTICCGQFKMAHRAIRPESPLRSYPSKFQHHRIFPSVARDQQGLNTEQGDKRAFPALQMIVD